MAINADWAKIRTEYETTNISQRKLAQKYNINYGTLRYRTEKEGWHAKKRKVQRKISEKLTQKTIKKIIDEKERTLSIHFDVSQKFMEIILEALKNESELYTFSEKIRTGKGRGFFNEEMKEFILKSVNDKKIINLITAFEKVQKLQRQTLGLDIEKENEPDKEQVKEFIESTKKNKNELKEIFNDET